MVLFHPRPPGRVYLYDYVARLAAYPELDRPLDEVPGNERGLREFLQVFVVVRFVHLLPPCASIMRGGGRGFRPGRRIWGAGPDGGP